MSTCTRGCRCSAVHTRLMPWMMCALFATCTVKVATAQTLNDAYNNELTRLKSEQSALQRAVSTAKSRGERARAGLVTEIEALSRRLTRLRADNNTQERALPQTGRVQSMQSQTRNIERRTRQIETWLETHGIHLSSDAVSTSDDPPSHQHPPLDRMVKAALDHVEEHGRVWLRTNQEYFGADGVATVGSVLRIAEVGAVVIDSGFTALDLASDGSLRVSERATEPSAVHGDARMVDVILFDSKDIRAPTANASTWREWLDQGGVVMWAIGALAVLAILVFLERLFAFALYLVRIRRAEGEGPSVSIAEDDRLLAALAAIQNGTGNAEVLETEAAESILRTQPYVHRGVSLLAVVASVAPLLGLLGTVTGMIGTFGMITEYGTGDPRLLSGGISEALLTTQFGLMVAIPALLFQTTLYRCGDVLLRRVENLALAALRLRVVNEETADAGVASVVPVRSAL